MSGRRLEYSIRELNGADVQQASLRLLADGGSKVGFRVLNRRGGRGESHTAITKRVPSSKFPLWIDMDLKEALLQGLADDGNTLRLELTCSRCRFRLHSSSPPKLNVITQRRLNVGPRTKRSSRTDCYKDNHRSRCCRHVMDVVFKDLPGFEFIVQPYNFDAGYCKGRCPARYNPAHHHALLQSLVRKQDRQRAPRPCCAPTKLADLEILHLDQDDPTVLKVSTWKNMRVLECACS